MTHKAVCKVLNAEHKSARRRHIGQVARWCIKMVSAAKKVRGRHRQDKYYQLAKEQGYRSRAAFKLIQLNKKHGFLNEARAVLDLCAAPGGWLQVCAKNMPLNARIVGVDLDAIKPVRGVTTLVDDITSQKCRERLKRESGGSLFDVVLNDGAPNVGGAFASELYTQAALVLDACKLACEFLRPEGTFVTKVFRSRDYNALLYAFRKLFRRVDATKPQASRNTSAEIFVVCSGYKAPAKIDPRLLDHRVLFQDLEEEAKPMGPDALLKSIGKKQRHRSGYESAVFHKAISAAAFVLAKDPMPLLAAFSAVVLDGPGSLELPEDVSGTHENKLVQDRCLDVTELADMVRAHNATSDEVRVLLKDLQVLGRSEFKQLLKWRLKVRKDVDRAEKAARQADRPAAEGDSAGSESGDEEVELTAEERLMKEMQDAKARVDQTLKRSRKKRREARKRAKVRLAAMAASSGVGEQLTADDDALFSLRTLKSKAALASTGDAAAIDEQDMAATVEAPDTDDELVTSEGESDLDSDDEALRYEQMVDQYLERQYQAYLERRAAKTANKAETRKRKRLEGNGDEDDDGRQNAADLDNLPSKPAGEGADAVLTEESEEEGGGLLVRLDEDQAGRRKSGAAVAEQWFAQAVFADVDLLAGEEDSVDGEDDGMDNTISQRARQLSQHGATTSALAADGTSAHERPPGARGAAAKRAVSEAKVDAGPPDGKRPDEARRGPPAAEEDDDDGIPMMKSAKALHDALQERQHADEAEMQVEPHKEGDGGGDSTDTEDEFAALDTHAQAEIRAMARKWLTSRKNQLGILDAAYNRYTFNDSALPRWFRDDESKHMRPVAAVTRAEIEAEKEALRAIDARPLKKVAEAKARKRRKVAKKMEQVRHKAETIADNEDISLRSKAREIGKLYAKAKAAGRDKRKVGKVASKMSRSQRETAKRKARPLDRRMIADKMKGKARAMTKAKKQGGRR